ncbi:MAG TPA: OBAP family protein [Micromonosporaceae bacterium]|nr:OBAP family protein [Micromonosporaceae bacterium]
MNPLIKDRSSPVRAAGGSKGPALVTLEQGAKIFQETTPLKGFDVYTAGFHCAKDHPEMQMEAHHYCRIVNDDLMQCVLFDGNTRDANLIGIEYIVSERLYRSLPEPERSSWHPHNFEVLSGQLIAPGLPDFAEKILMKRMMNSYGKTWHLWHTGRHDAPGHNLPVGDPMLMWSYNREGECDPALIRNRNEAMGVDAEKKRAMRQSLVDEAEPQYGVDQMKDEFAGPTTPIPGVRDIRQGQEASA